mgnify:CR=1 FL=1
MTDYVHQDDVDFSSWLEKSLEKHNVRASDVARAIGVNRSTISLWRSEKQSPRAEYVSRLAEYFSTFGEQTFNYLVREILFSVHVSEMRRSR